MYLYCISSCYLSHSLLVLFNEFLKALNAGSNKFANLASSLVQQESGHSGDTNLLSKFLKNASEPEVSWVIIIKEKTYRQFIDINLEELHVLESSCAPLFKLWGNPLARTAPSGKEIYHNLNNYVRIQLTTLHLNTHQSFSSLHLTVEGLFGFDFLQAKKKKKKS